MLNYTSNKRNNKHRTKQPMNPSTYFMDEFSTPFGREDLEDQVN